MTTVKSATATESDILKCTLAVPEGFYADLALLLLAFCIAAWLYVRVWARGYW